jgi:hypothetical protein
MLERGPASGRFVRRLNAWLVILSSSFADPPQQQMRRSTIGPVRFRSRWPTRFAGPEFEQQVSALRDSLGMVGRRFELAGAAWFTGSRSSRRPDTLPAIGPFAQPGQLTYPLPLRDVALLRGGHQYRPFMQTLAATIASADRRLTSPSRSRSGEVAPKRSYRR